MQGPYTALYAMIEDGRLSPGDRLLETELAAQLGVSRTPVREAIRRLEAAGLVVHQPRVGAVVRSLGQQEIVELYEMRIVLEVTAAKMAANHASAAELRRLRELNAAMGQTAVDPAKLAKLNRKFHRCLLEAGRNQFLVQCYEGLAHILILLGKTTLETEERVDTVVGQHQAILDALDLGDGLAASQAMELHMETSLNHRLRALHLDG